tara:strand:+ start:427 stop:945 length:519 start_codon:yes stop_codon:yes gene_type:complete
MVDNEYNCFIRDNLDEETKNYISNYTDVISECINLEDFSKFYEYSDLNLEFRNYLEKINEKQMFNILYKESQHLKTFRNRVDIRKDLYTKWKQINDTINSQLVNESSPLLPNKSFKKENNKFFFSKNFHVLDAENVVVTNYNQKNRNIHLMVAFCFFSLAKISHYFNDNSNN